MIIDQQFAKGFYQADSYGVGQAWSWVSGNGSVTTLVHRWDEVIELDGLGEAIEVETIA